jgi:hypothetical protein
VAEIEDIHLPSFLPRENRYDLLITGLPSAPKLVLSLALLVFKSLVVSHRFQFCCLTWPIHYARFGGLGAGARLGASALVVVAVENAPRVIPERSGEAEVVRRGESRPCGGPSASAPSGQAPHRERLPKGFDPRYFDTSRRASLVGLSPPEPSTNSLGLLVNARPSYRAAGQSYPNRAQYAL